MEIVQHVTDPSVRMTSGGVVDGVTFRQVGSTIGRFLFSFSPAIEIEAGSSHAKIINCKFFGSRGLHKDCK